MYTSVSVDDAIYVLVFPTSTVSSTENRGAWKIRQDGALGPVCRKTCVTNASKDCENWLKPKKIIKISGVSAKFFGSNEQSVLERIETISSECTFLKMSQILF